MPESSRKVLAVIEDMIFRSRVEAAAAPLGITVEFVAAAAALGSALNVPWPLVIVDLNTSTADPLELIAKLRRAQPTVPIVGYCAHEQIQLRQQANEAGCTAVLARSAMVQTLPQLLADAGRG